MKNRSKKKKVNTLYDSVIPENIQLKNVKTFSMSFVECFSSCWFYIK